MPGGKRASIALIFGALLVYADYATRQPLPGFARVTVRIHSPDGKATGLRLRVTNQAGDYFAPLGHLPTPDQTRRNANDLILGDGQDTPLEVHALVYDGTEIDLPPGKYNFHANKGYEYQTLDVPVEIRKAERSTVTLPLNKFIDFESRGWYPGDTHMHFPAPAGVRYQMECEGLRVCSLLILKNGYRAGRPGDGNFENIEYFTGKLSPVSDANYFVKVGEEFRHGLLAHLLLQNLKSIVWPVSVGGLRENGVGGFDWPMMMDAADDAHEQGALVSWAHWPYPSLEAPLDIALGRIDSIDLLTTGDPFEHHPILVDVYKMHGPRVYSMAPIDVYYHYLNCGFHLAMSSGSDKMALNPPMGSARTYVKTDGPLSYDSWIEGIRKGHTFASNYPLLEFTVNGQLPGETLHLGSGTARLKVHARAQSLEPYDQLEIIHNGKVIRTVKPSGDHYEATIDETIEVDRGGWIAARAHGRKMLEYGATWWKMPVLAHSSPIYLDMPGRPALAADSALLFLDQLGYLERWARQQAKFPSRQEQAEVLRRIAEARAVYEKAGRS
jgi:TolB protein